MTTPTLTKAPSAIATSTYDPIGVYTEAAHAVIGWANWACQDALGLYNRVGSSSKAKAKTALDLMRIARDQSKTAYALALALPRLGAPGAVGNTYPYRAQYLAAIESSRQVLVKFMVASNAFKAVPQSSVLSTQVWYDYMGVDINETMYYGGYAVGMGYLLDCYMLSPNGQPNRWANGPMRKAKA